MPIFIEIYMSIVDPEYKSLNYDVDLRRKSFQLFSIFNYSAITAYLQNSLQLQKKRYNSSLINMKCVNSTTVQHFLPLAFSFGLLGL